jgi:hypothetical protein
MEVFMNLLNLLGLHLTNEEFKRLWKKISNGEINVISYTDFHNLLIVANDPKETSELGSGDISLTDFITKTISVLLIENNDNTLKKQDVVLNEMKIKNKDERIQQKSLRRRTSYKIKSIANIGGMPIIKPEIAATKIKSVWRGK